MSIYYNKVGLSGFSLGHLIRGHLKIGHMSSLIPLIFRVFLNQKQLQTILDLSKTARSVSLFGLRKYVCVFVGISKINSFGPGFLFAVLEQSPFLAVLPLFFVSRRQLSHVSAGVSVSHPFNHSINTSPTTLPTLRQLKMIIII